jgi:hypothetical protein
MRDRYAFPNFHHRPLPPPVLLAVLVARSRGQQWPSSKAQEGRDELDEGSPAANQRRDVIIDHADPSAARPGGLSASA